MALALLAIAGGFALLIFAANRFVEGAAASARHLGMPALVIGMVIVGFGTSAPEIVVSGLAALDGNPALALGNALGSNIVNTGLILGVTALIVPIAVHSKIIRRELPLLLIVGLTSGVFFWDGALSRAEALGLLMGFFVVVAWTLWAALREQDDALEAETEEALAAHPMTLGRALLWLGAGLLLLVVSARVLVWGAVTVAQALGVSDLVIGLTIVALGTSLPEFAASVVAVRKGEHDIALGNVVGSNMFNLLAVVGVAGVIAPMAQLDRAVLTRDWPVMIAMTLVLYVMAYGFRGQGRINRAGGGLLLMAYLAYNAFLAMSL